MTTNYFKNSRRGFFGALAFGATAIPARGGFPDDLTPIPATNEGPFYPTKLSLDTDNALLIVVGYTPAA